LPSDRLDAAASALMMFIAYDINRLSAFSENLPLNCCTRIHRKAIDSLLVSYFLNCRFNGLVQDAVTTKQSPGQQQRFLDLFTRLVSNRGVRMGDISRQNRSEFAKNLREFMADARSSSL